MYSEYKVVICSVLLCRMILVVDRDLFSFCGPSKEQQQQQQQLQLGQLLAFINVHNRTFRWHAGEITEASSRALCITQRSPLPFLAIFFCDFDSLHCCTILSTHDG